MQRSVGTALLAALLLTSACRAEPARRAVARVNGGVITVSMLTRELPKTVNPERDEMALKRRYLETLVDRELLAREAERRGLDEVIDYYYEVGKKGYVQQELYRHVTAPARDVSPATLDSAYRMLTPEYELRMIEVGAESIARLIEAELARGVEFESLAVRWSELVNAPAGGDIGWLPLLWLEPVVKAEARLLSPGEHTRAVPVRDRWQFIKVVAEREPDPPPPPLEEMQGALTVRLRQHRQQVLAQDYQARLRRRLEYLPEGLAVITKSAESIAPAERETPVAILDGAKYVKVGRLMHIINRFTPALDTAMRRYTVQREIEEDLMYEDALEFGLDQVPSVRDSLDAYRRRLLLQALHEQAIVDSVTVGEDELRAWYEQNREKFGGADFASAVEYIQPRLLQESRAEAHRALVERLRAGAKVRIDERVLRGIRQNPDGSWQ